MIRAVLSRAGQLARSDRTMSLGAINAALLAETDDVAAAHNAQRVITVVVIGVVALIGTLVAGEVYDAAEGTVSGTPMDDEFDEVAEGLDSAMGFIPIVLIVLLASLVIGVVQRL